MSANGNHTQRDDSKVCFSPLKVVEGCSLISGHSLYLSIIVALCVCLCFTVSHCLFHSSMSLCLSALTSLSCSLARSRSLSCIKESQRDKRILPAPLTIRQSGPIHHIIGVIHYFRSEVELGVGAGSKLIYSELTWILSLCCGVKIPPLTYDMHCSIRMNGGKFT